MEINMSTMTNYKGFTIRINTYGDGVDYTNNSNSWVSLVRTHNNSALISSLSKSNTNTTNDYLSPLSNLFRKKSEEVVKTSPSHISNTIDNDLSEIEKIQREAEEKRLRNEKEREELEYEREQQKLALQKEQEELERQQAELERQEEEREEKLRLDYCGHCHEPIGSVEYEEIYINKLNYRIHKSCINEFKKSDSELFNEWKLSD